MTRKKSQCYSHLHRLLISVDRRWGEAAAVQTRLPLRLLWRHLVVKINIRGHLHWSKANISFELQGKWCGKFQTMWNTPDPQQKNHRSSFTHTERRTKRKATSTDRLLLQYVFTWQWNIVFISDEYLQALSSDSHNTKANAKIVFDL